MSTQVRLNAEDDVPCGIVGLEQILENWTKTIFTDECHHNRGFPILENICDILALENHI